jgi:hypothetical protein
LFKNTLKFGKLDFLVCLSRCNLCNFILRLLTKINSTSFLAQMDTAEIESLLSAIKSVEPYELAYSIYLYCILLVSFFLTMLIFYSFFNAHTKLDKQLKIIFMHLLVTNLALTATVCLFQVGFYCTPRVRIFWRRVLTTALKLKKLLIKMLNSGQTTNEKCMIRTQQNFGP